MATQKKASKATLKAKAGSLSGDHFTLEQVAQECIGFQTESEVLKDKKGTISDHFMDAAKMYITKKPKKGEEMAVDHAFLVACNAQETASKSESAGMYQWDKVPPAWSQMKSNIKAAFNMGLDINSYTSESAMRKDLNEARKAAKAENKSDEEKAQEQVEGALDDMVKSGNVLISQRVFAIVESCKDLTDAQVGDVEQILANALENILLMKHLVSEVGEESEQVAAA